MRNLKKFLALVLAMMMTLSLMVTVNAKSFDDVDSTSTYAEAIAVLKGLGVVKGDENSKFNPKDPITRAEVAAMIYRLVTADVDDSNVKLYENSGYFFSDVFSGKWYNGYVNYCANNGLVKGVGGDRFAPSSPVTGYEALVMILRAIGYTNDDTFTGSDWKFKASGYARELGITDGIAEGTLGGPATREMVAQIMFNGLQAPMVRGNILGYSPIELVAATDANREHYARYLASGGSLPICETLLHRSFNIVGKSKELSRDDFGRPSHQWVYDNKNDKAVSTADGSGTLYGNACKYIINSTKYNGTDPIARSAEKTLKINLDYFKVYDNVITECQLATDINDNKTFKADVWLNGYNLLDADDNGTINVIDSDNLKEIDKIHTVNTYVNSQGRTLEAYKYTDPADGSTKFTLVFIDTVLGVVTEVTPHTEDTAGHLMQQASMKVAVGQATSSSTYTEIEYKSDTDYTYKVGDRVLVQSANGCNARAQQMGSAGDLDTLLDPNDFNDANRDAGRGGHKPIYLSKDVTVVPAVTVKGTKGDAEYKTGIEGTDGKVYWLSNVYSRGIDTNRHPTIGSYYVPVTNNLINRTFNLYLDHHGYVVGMQETSSTNVGVVTFVDYNRLRGGQYTVEVTVTDVNGQEQTLQLLNHAAVTADPGNGIEARPAKDFFQSEATAKAYFVADGLGKINQEGAGAAADAAAANNQTLAENLLIEWSNVTKNGTQYQVITKVGTDAAATVKDTIDDANTRPGDDANKADVHTGVTDTLSAVERIDNDSRFLIANYTVDYSAVADDNEGNMVLDGFKPYTGFKTIPTINSVSTTAGEQVKFSTLTSGGVDYFAIFAGDKTKGYVMTSQEKFTPDESYLAVKTGTTYQFNSTYKMLKDGAWVTPDVSVANKNTTANAKLEGFMADKITVDLITFTGLDAAGNVNDVDASNDKGHFNTRPDATVIAGDGTYPKYDAGVLTVDSGDDTWLTLADTCKIVIVNSALGEIYPGTTASIGQYAKNTDQVNYFCYELDANGYVSVLYIVD